jgi:hypothetical protein
MDKGHLSENLNYILRPAWKETKRCSILLFWKTVYKKVIRGSRETNPSQVYFGWKFKLHKCRVSNLEAKYYLEIEFIMAALKTCCFMTWRSFRDLKLNSLGQKSRLGHPPNHPQITSQISPQITHPPPPQNTSQIIPPPIYIQSLITLRWDVFKKLFLEIITIKS